MISLKTAIDAITLKLKSVYDVDETGLTTIQNHERLWHRKRSSRLAL